MRPLRPEARRLGRLGLGTALLAWVSLFPNVHPAVAQSPPRGPSAEGLVLALMSGYDGRTQPRPERWPLVPRLQDQLKRTDLAADVFTGEQNLALDGLVIDAAEWVESRRARVVVRYRLTGAERIAVIDLDASEGQWLITDIRPSSGPSFRQMLRISR